MHRVVISGFYGYNNAGDEAILQSMVSEMRKAYSDIDIVVLSANPLKTIRDFKVKAVNRLNLYQIYSAIKNCDVFISGGGSLFQDATSIWTPWYYGGVIMIAFMLNKPVFAFAQGIGPVRSNIDRKLLKYIMNKVNYISVRDKRSEKELKKLGILKDISCTVDPAFLIHAQPNEKSYDILNKESKGEKLVRPRIGFSIRKWKGDTDITGIMAEVADRVYRELGADIVLFPLHYKKDIQIAEEISEKMKEKAIVIRGHYTTEELISLYGLVNINVSVRFHGLVFSIMNNKPLVAISYDPKIDSFMELLGMNNVLRYNELNVQNVFNAIKVKWVNREEISKQIHLKSDEFKVLAQKGVDEIVKVLKEIKEK